MGVISQRKTIWRESFSNTWQSWCGKWNRIAGQRLCRQQENKGGILPEFVQKETVVLSSLFFSVQEVLDIVKKVSKRK